MLQPPGATAWSGAVLAQPDELMRCAGVVPGAVGVGVGGAPLRAAYAGGSPALRRAVAGASTAEAIERDGRQHEVRSMRRSFWRDAGSISVLMNAWIKLDGNNLQIVLWP